MSKIRIIEFDNEADAKKYLKNNSSSKTRVVEGTKNNSNKQKTKQSNTVNKQKAKLHQNNKPKQSNKNNKPKQSNKNNKPKQNGQLSISQQVIKLDQIYDEMYEARRLRAQQQDNITRYWNEVKNYGYDRKEAIKNAGNKVGEYTYTINKAISKLCKYKLRHKAMNDAYQYLLEEIARVDKSIDKQNRVINGFRTGRHGLIDSSGKSIYSDKGLVNYVNKKTESRQILVDKLNYVKQYLN